MTELLEDKRYDAALDESFAAFEPEALISEARRRQRKRQVAIGIVVAAAMAAGIFGYLSLSRSSAPSSPTSGGGEVGRPARLLLHLRGFGSPLPAQIDAGPCPQGRTRIEIRPNGSAVGCVLTIRKWDGARGVKQITQTVRETYRLSGGTLVTREAQTIRFDRDQRHTTAVFRGKIVGGSGRYARARGTVSGGGPGVDGRSDWTLTLHLTYR